MGRPATVYKVCDAGAWAAAEEAGVFEGVAIDRTDGYIHFSSAAQLGDTVEKHFAGLTGLVLVAVDAAALGSALRWEPSRGGDLFPHLYGALPMSAVRWARPLEEDGEGGHALPSLTAEP